MNSPVSLVYDARGNRKYLTAAERRAFLAAASRLPPRARLFCALLAYTGARLSELVYLTVDRIDLDARVIVLESLKKRQRGVFRAVPVPLRVLRDLDKVFDIRAAQGRPGRHEETLWGFGRTTGWKVVKRAMDMAGVRGLPASPKGLRHAFAVSALQAGVPITLVCKWLGHARVETTAIYADVVGDEECSLARRLWSTFGPDATGT